MKFIRYFTAADQSALYSTFFTANSEKSEIAMGVSMRKKNIHVCSLPVSGLLLGIWPSSRGFWELHNSFV